MLRGLFVAKIGKQNDCPGETAGLEILQVLTPCHPPYKRLPRDCAAACTYQVRFWVILSALRGSPQARHLRATVDLSNVTLTGG